MKKVIKICIAVAFICFLFFVGYQVISKINHKNQVAENIKTMPNFEYVGLDGNLFTQKQVKQSTPILFVYFNSECEYCNEEAEMIKESISKLKEVQLFFVSFEKPEQIKAFATNHQLLTYDNITFLCDSKVTFATTFDVKSLPCLVLYDKDQHLIEKIKGQTKVDVLLQKLAL